MRLTVASPNQYQLYAAVAVSVFAWSFGPICVRYAFQYDMPPDLIAALRMMIGAIVFAPFVWVKYKPEIQSMSRQHILLALAAGALFGLNLIAMTTSLQHISILINQVLIGTMPVWVAVLEVSVLKSQLNRMIWMGILVAFAGGIIIALATSSSAPIIVGGNPILGVGLALVSAVAAAFYLTIGRNVRSRTSFIPYIWLIYASGSIVTLAVVAINQVPIIGYDIRGYFWVFMLTLLAQIIGHGALNYVVKFLPPTILSVAGQSVPILSAIWALLIFTEIPSPLQMVGGVVILVGVFIVATHQNKPTKESS